jgi:hypothetical protein
MRAERIWTWASIVRSHAASCLTEVEGFQVLLERKEMLRSVMAGQRGDDLCV